MVQELRGAHASDVWTQGTLGAFHFEVAQGYSALSALYMGECATGINALLGYQTLEGTIRAVYWNTALDSWNPGINITGATPRANFVSFLRNSVWRIFAVNIDSAVEQYDCVECCDEVFWKPGE